MDRTLLHGTIQLTICEASNLQENGKFGSWALGKEPYVVIHLDDVEVGRTKPAVGQPANPVWNESFHIYCSHLAKKIIFTIKGGNFGGGESTIGSSFLSVDQKFLAGEELDVSDQKRNPLSSGAKIHVKLKYEDATKHLHWGHGIIAPDIFHGVPHTFFEQRGGCKMRLYVDAHVSDAHVTPEISLSGGKKYERNRCWEDVFNDIMEAKHLVYITGWSVDTEIKLRRDPDRPRRDGDELTLGELLKKKASEGVRVLILVWKDPTSFGLRENDGIMKTHCKETATYFKNTDVHCVLCPRKPSHTAKLLQTDVVLGRFSFSHHQKTVVVDSAVAVPDGSGSDERRIVSYVGGLDLCDGRYDTPFHSLFGTLAQGQAHHEDFYQGNFPGASIKRGGPREPWHGIHCRLEGPVALDVLKNFEQRWKKQGGDKHLLLQLDDIIIPPSPVTSEDDLERWNIQLFRSIDSAAAIRDRENTPEHGRICRGGGGGNWLGSTTSRLPIFKKKGKKGKQKLNEAKAWARLLLGIPRSALISRNGNFIERDIHHAYINAIRRASSFIYVENQYFIGSSFSWNLTNGDIGASNLIPKEISLKIVNKINAGERFSVYVVIPMWPEGVPEGEAVQAMLYWQRRTMDMMYKDITKALRSVKREEDPRNYLSFFCLANREVRKDGEYEPSKQPQRGTAHEKAQKARRGMIYVHSKMMIVDDEYIIVGSANINQRSMDGSRDTEIAIGAFQPHYIATRQSPARGEVHGFRMALWHEHLGMYDGTFESPESLECMKKVNSIADENWNLYTSKECHADLPGHLVRYPIDVSPNGAVTELEGFKYFPDTKARVRGTRSKIIPAILTT